MASYWRLLRSPANLPACACAAGIFFAVSVAPAAAQPTVSSSGSGPAYPVANAATFGVVCDNATDNTTALNNFFSELSSTQGPTNAGRGGILPQGVCRFSGTLTLPSFYYQVEGAGPYSTVLLYDGSATNVDLLIQNGTSATATIGRGRLANFRIASTTVMAAGAALHIRDASRVSIEGVVFDGQDGNRNLWNGLYLDQVDNIRMSGAWEAYAQNDCVAMSGAGAAQSGVQYDIFVSRGRAGGCTNGIHIGGGLDNVHIGDVEAPGNSVGLLIDTALTGAANQEIYVERGFSPGQSGADAVQVNDALCAQAFLCYLVIDNDLAGAAQNGLHVKAWGVAGTNNGTILITSPYVAKNGAAGLQIDTSNPTIILAPQVLFDQNTTYGISAATAVTVVNCGLFRRSGTGTKTSNVTCGTS